MEQAEGVGSAEQSEGLVVEQAQAPPMRRLGETPRQQAVEATGLVQAPCGVRR